MEPIKSYESDEKILVWEQRFTLIIGIIMVVLMIGTA